MHSCLVRVVLSHVPGGKNGRQDRAADWPSHGSRTELTFDLSVHPLSSPRATLLATTSLLG